MEFNIRKKQDDTPSVSQKTERPARSTSTQFNIRKAEDSQRSPARNAGGGRTGKVSSPALPASGSRNAAQARSGKSRESYDSSVRDRLTQQRAAKGGQRSTLNTNEDAYDWVGQRAVRKKADKKGSDMDGWKLLEGMAVKGGTRFAEGIASTLDLAERQLLNAQEVFMPTGGERVAQGGPFRALHQAVKQNRIDAENYYNPNVEKGGTPAKVADFLGTITAEAIPQGAVAAISAGAKVAQVGVDVVTKAEQLAPGLWNSIRTVAGNAAKNPAFWSSFMQTVGNDYEEAISDGASEWKAVSYALTNGLLNAGIEVGGGLETMDPAKGFGVKDWVKSAVEEGNEEVGQGIVQRGLQNLVYQKGNPLASVTDGDAVLNPMTSAQEWSGGAFAGGVLSGARIGANYIGKQIYQQQLADVGAEYRSAPEALVERGLSFPEETQAHRTAAQMQEKMNAGTALTDTDLGEMVAANERARAQQRRLEWANTPARERENIARQAVARGQLEQVKATFGEHGARALTAMYDAEQDTGAYAGGFAAAYQAGLTGKGLEEVPGRYAGALTRAQAQAAYYAGENDRALSLRRETLAAQYAPAAGADSGLVYDDFVRQAVESGRTQEDVNGEERVYLTAETAERVNTVAKALGLRAQFVDSVAGGKANAQISGDTVLLERDNPNPVLFLMGHEAAHRMQQLAPTEYRAFRDIAVAEYGPEVVQRRIDDYAAQGVSLTWEWAMDEVAADKAGQLMDGGAVLDEFIRAHRENKPLLEKLRDAIRSFLAKLTGREKKKAQTAQGKLTAALEAAAKEAKTLQGQSDNGKMAAKYSIKEGWTVADGELDEHGAPIFAQTRAQADIKAYDHLDLKQRRKEAVKHFGLDAKESISLSNYTQWLFYEINDRLLHGATEKDSGIVERITAALKKFPQFEGRTYRNLEFQDEAAYQAFLEECSADSTVTLKAFTSTSKRPNGYPKFGQYSVHMVIDGVTGADIADTYGIPRQQEVILLPGTGIKITGVETANDGHPLIYAQEVRENELGRDHADGRPARSAESDRAEGTYRADTSGRNDGAGRSVLQTAQGQRGRNVVLSERGPGHHGLTEDEAKHSLKTGTLTKSYSAILEENRLLREQAKDYLALQRRNRALEASRDYWQGQTRRSRQVTTDRKAVEKVETGLSTSWTGPRRVPRPGFVLYPKYSVNSASSSWSCRKGSCSPSFAEWMRSCSPEGDISAGKLPLTVMSRPDSSRWRSSPSIFQRPEQTSSSDWPSWLSHSSARPAAFSSPCSFKTQPEQPQTVSARPVSVGAAQSASPIPAGGFGALPGK